MKIMKKISLALILLIVGCALLLAVFYPRKTYFFVPYSDVLAFKNGDDFLLRTSFDLERYQFLSTWGGLNILSRPCENSLGDEIDIGFVIVNRNNPSVNQITEFENISYTPQSSDCIFFRTEEEMLIGTYYESNLIPFDQILD